MQRHTTPKTIRHLPLAGTYNVRDIGGYRTRDGRITRWRTIFRADSLHRLPEEAQNILLEHGVRTVIDLRRTDETEKAPNVFATTTTVTYRHLSLMHDVRPEPQNRRSLIDVYRRILDERQEQVGEALRVLAHPDAPPAVIHCTAGKDRTGLITALLLGLAGVPEETIVEDYAQSSIYLDGSFWEDVRQRVIERGESWAAYEPLMRCLPDDMRTTLQYLADRYGGCEAYTRTIGLDADHIETLRSVVVQAGCKTQNPIKGYDPRGKDA